MISRPPRNTLANREKWQNPAACGVASVLMLLALSSPAYAVPDTPMAYVLCEIVDWFQGNLGRGLATIGVSAIAIGAIFGKISWGLALTVGVGVVVMFGATAALIEIGVIGAGIC